MGDVSAYTDAARLYNNCGKMVTTVLTSVVTPPPRLLYYINIFSSLACLVRKGKSTSLRAIAMGILARCAVRACLTSEHSQNI